MNPLTTHRRAVHPPISRRPRLFARGLLVLLVSGLALSAQDLPFSSGSNGSDGPLDVPAFLQNRANHAAAYDAARGEVVVFGGYNGSYLGDTWLYDGETWRVVVPANSPSPRQNAAMAYDAARQEVVLFGGYTGSARLGDTWVWDGANWTQKTPVTNPTPREEAGFAYDEVREEVVMFGGYSGSYLGDTWVWNGTNWVNRSPANAPSSRSWAEMCWNGQNNKVLLYGGYSNLSDTWEWDGTNWTQISVTSPPSGRYGHSMAYDPGTGLVYMVGSQNSSTLNDTWTYDTATGWTQVYPKITPINAEMENIYHGEMVYAANIGELLHIGGYRRNVGYTSWVLQWDAGNWNIRNSVTYYFDMRPRLTGVWNFTSINVPPGVTVRFIRNTGNTPVVWLASEDVVIDGSIDLSGENGYYADFSLRVPQAGPGGFDGGIGGLPFNNTGSYLAGDGQGPGGGAGGTNPFDNNLDDGENAGYYNVYGNNFIIPLIGGSGGGGTPSDDDGFGTCGGAGGGALLIASSRDLTLNGSILSRGGDDAYSSAAGGYSGNGSGGAVKLMADRLFGGGVIDVRGGSNGTGDYYGRIRLEAFERILASASHYGYTSASAPVTDNLAAFLTTQPTLSITQVAGEAVAQPPSGDPADPDVIFSDGGSVNIVVQGTNVPDGTPITVVIVFSGGSTTLPSSGTATMNGGSAIVSGVIPSGVGVLSAYAEFIAN